jgi:hypothetical protein
MTDDEETRPDVDEDEDRSLIEKAKDKIEDLMDAPEAADDPIKTNPVTGQRRDP